MRYDALLWASGQTFRQPTTVKLLTNMVHIPSTLLDPTLIAFVGQCWKRWPALAKFLPNDPFGYSHHPLPPLALLGPFVYCTLTAVVELKLNQPISHCQSTGSKVYKYNDTSKSFKGKMHLKRTVRELRSLRRETNCVAIGEEEYQV